MNITFLVGNGFDISADVDTSYMAFYKWYIKQPNNDSASIKMLKDEIGTYLKKIKEENHLLEKENTWADFELGLGAFTDRFTLETVNDFLDCYEDAHASIIRFLTGLEKDFSPSLLNDEERISFAEGIRDYYQDLSDIEKNLFDSIMKDRSSQSVSVRFINFNYTTIFDKCINLILHKPLINNNIRKMTIDKNILHIHGNLQHYPVIGLNDESQIANKELLKSSDFVRTVIKKENISYCGEMTYSKAKKLIENSRIICIWGMSLGDTDADWWKLICKVLLRDGTRHVIIFCYKEDPPNEVSIVKTLRIKEPIKNRLLSYSSMTDVQKDSIIDRIHVVINTQRVLKLPTPET